MSQNDQTTVTIATASEVPVIGQTDAERIETTKLIVSNYDGGLSFSLSNAFENAISTNNVDTANKCLVSLVERLAIMGTTDTRIDINAKRLTKESDETFRKMCIFNVDLIVSTLRDIYSKGRSPKVSNIIRLIATMTSITKTNAGSENLMMKIRSAGYSLVSMFNIPTHLFEWIDTHITMCSIDNGSSIPDTNIAKTLTKDRKNKSLKVKRAGGTGEGFRNSVMKWYSQFWSGDVMRLAFLVAKYNNRHNFTHGDVLSLIHAKCTTAEKCQCKPKNACKCPKPTSNELKDVILISGQIVLAYAVHGLEHACKIFLEGYERAIYNGEDNIEHNTHFRKALDILVFFAAVEEAKSESVTENRLISLINCFNLSREMISNKYINNVNVMFNLTISESSNQLPRQSKIVIKNDILKKLLPIHSIIDAVYNIVDDENMPRQTIGLSGMRITMPITALIRNLNNLTTVGMFDRNILPRADEIIAAVCDHITNPVVLARGLIHPINVFNSWAVYSKGHGLLGSKSWSPNAKICKALLDATELSFTGLKGFDASIAFLMDASGSMHSAGSASGFPSLTAAHIAVLLVMSFYRASEKFARENNNPTPRHSIGYFSGNQMGYVGNSNNTTQRSEFTREELQKKCNNFKDVTDKFYPQITFDEAKKALGNGTHMGTTDIGASIWYHITTLLTSIDNIVNNNPNYQNLTVFQLPGYHEILMLITDNDVNSGDQPMDVLKLYWKLVRDAFGYRPYDKDGNQCNPDELFDCYVPKLVVIATQGTPTTVGDPRDPRILNISGFDSSTPTLIDMFLNRYESDIIDNNDNDDNE